MRCPHCNSAIAQISVDEIEAFRLTHIQGMTIDSAAAEMGVHRSMMYYYLSNVSRKTGVSVTWDAPPVVLSLDHIKHPKIVAKW